MDRTKTGALIAAARKEQNMTQKELAAALHVSDRAVSKWERGAGFPDISLLERLGQVFSVDMESLLSGSLDPNTLLGGNMKKTRFYICPTCGNIITALGDASVSCCGKKLTAVAYERKRGRKVSVYMVEVHDDEGKHIADATFTMFYTGATLEDMKY